MPVSPPNEVVASGVPANIAQDMTIAEQHEWLQTFLRRRPVSRRGMLLGGLAGAGAATLGTTPFGRAAYAATAADSPLLVGGRHTAFGVDPARQLRLAAQLTRNPGRGRILVDIGPTRGLGGTVEAEVRPLLSQVPQVDGSILSVEQFYVHAAFDRLAPGREYYYRFRVPGGATTPVQAVRTGHAKGRHGGPFRFTMMGDHGSNTTPQGDPKGLFDDNYYKPDNEPTVAHASAITAAIARQDPAFHLLAGDICYADPSGAGKPPQRNPTGQPPAGFDNYDPTVWDVYLADIELSSARSPWMFATGNHDMEALYSPHGYGGHAARLDLPGDGPKGCPSVYSFVYGNVAVLSLDANDVSFEIKTNTGYSGGAQTSWVERTLKGYRNDPDIDFIVCFFHHCAYSTTTQHASDGGVRGAWAGLFDRYQVDLVLQGHNHLFERSDPIRNNAPTREAPDGSTIEPATDGTIYITAGSAGRPRYQFQTGEVENYRGKPAPAGSNIVPNSYVWAPDGTKTPEAISWSRTRFDNYAFVAVDSAPGHPGGSSTLTVRGVDEHGTEFDRVVLKRPVPRHR
ncbi:metallophosphoesterase [Frankia tisae]|uniref:metallophosphoesterase n=1 Tax=Frankia tisae TaxID=2950104 RepID=UPI0021C05102|nr:metallophosphoesterase [Frankia tisae]